MLEKYRKSLKALKTSNHDHSSIQNPGVQRPQQPSARQHSSLSSHPSVLIGGQDISEAQLRLALDGINHDVANTNDMQGRKLDLLLKLLALSNADGKRQR